MDGFSFHGTHCSALGCYYRPSAKSRGDEMESYDIADIQTDSRNGGYYTVGKNKQEIAEYIRSQMDEDKLGEQLTMFGKDDDPFKGGR